MKQLVTYKSTDYEPESYGFMVFESIEATQAFFRTAEIYFEMFPGNKLQTIYRDLDRFVEYSNYKEFRNDFEVKNVSDEDYEVLLTYFNSGFDVSFGEQHIFEIVEMFPILPEKQHPLLCQELRDINPGMFV